VIGSGDVDRVVVRLPQGQAGEGHVGGVDADQLVRLIGAVEDHGVSIAGVRAQRDPRRQEREPGSEVAVVEGVDAVVEEDRRPARRGRHDVPER
jgi:hypothetical protein